jgi:hypothetical protein
VRPLSAAGDVDDVVRLRGLHHLDLLNHPHVYGRLREWLAGVLENRRPPATGSA